MTSSLLSELLKLHSELTLREDVRGSLLNLATDIMASSGLVPAAHHRFLLKYLDRIAEGEIRRLMVLMPPGSAKSTYTSVIFPVWWFMRHPRASIIAASHTAGLAEHFSRQVQGLIEEKRFRIGYDLVHGDRTAAHWRTTTGGEYYAAGIRGAITGRRADLVIIDDPVKSMAEAGSERHRRHVWEWYSTELTPRLKPDARVVLVMTRWHEQDLGGQLLARDGPGWTVLRLPAIAETGDALGRPVGSPLWPDWEGLATLDQKRVLVGDRVWAALFQQSPRPEGGRLFRVDAIEVVDPGGPRELDAGRWVRAWDLAATAPAGHADPDWTVGLKLASIKDGRFAVEDIVRFRGNPREVEDTIVATARSDGHAVLISLPIDPGQAGKAQIAHLSSLLPGFRISSSREQGSKWARAQPVAAQIEAGNVAVVRAPWLRGFMEELAVFPHGGKDDQVDALARAFNTLADMPAGGRRVFLPFNAR